MPSVQEMMADLQTADAHGDTQLAQHIAAQIRAAQSPHGAIAGEPDLGDVGNSLLAGGIHAVHNLPLVGDAAITAGRWANDVLNGRQTSWGQANSEAHQTIESAQRLHPVASTVGGVLGGADAAVIGGGALKAAGVAAPAVLAVQRGRPLLNAGRLALLGAGAGAAQGAAQASGEQLAGGHVDQALPAAAQGAASGAVFGGALGGAAGVAPGVARAAVAPFRPLAGKTAQALSRVFGETASDLQATYASMHAAMRRPPSMAELATLKQRGAISGAAKGSSPITEALSNRADEAATLRSRNMQAAVQPGPGPASSGEFENARTTRGDADYAASRAAPDFSIPTEESADLGGVSPADHIASEILPQAGLGKADRVRIMNDLQAGKLSSQDAQLVRSGLNDSLGRSFSPATKGFLADFDAITHGPGNEAPAGALDAATANFAANSRRAEGAAHGEGVLGAATPENYAAVADAKPNANPEFQGAMPGGAGTVMAKAAATPEGAVSLAQRFATDDSLHAKLTTAIGQPAADALRDLGAAETKSAANLAPFKNRAPAADDETSGDAKRVIQGVLAGVSHGPWAVYHAVKALGLQGMSPAVQEKVAQYLADPKMVQQGINLVRKAGATNAQMRQLAMSAAHLAGGTAGGLANNAVE